MGASESTLPSPLRPEDQITTVSERIEGVDPILEKLKSLKIATPILTAPPAESSLTDLLVRKPSSSSKPVNICVNTKLSRSFQGRLVALSLSLFFVFFCGGIGWEKGEQKKCLIYPTDMFESQQRALINCTLNPKVILELFSMYRDWQEEKARKISSRQEDIENKIEIIDALAIKLVQRFNGSLSAMKTASQHLSEVDALQVELGELKGRLTEVVSNCDSLCKRISLEGPDPLRTSIIPFSKSTQGNASSNSSSGVVNTSQVSREA